MAFNVWLENRTPFEAATNVQVDLNGQEVLVAIFSASFSPSDNGQLIAAEEQLPVALCDTWFGDPASSSTRYEADIVPVKPAAEIIIIGTAHAPNGKPVREMQAGFMFAGLRKVLNVVGDRIYDAGSYSQPRPFNSMPIVYERAYGGTIPNGPMDRRNPLGVGYRHAASADPEVRTQAPNITYPDEPFTSPSDRPRPAGFGPLGRSWLPRLPLAGTYDEAWLASQWPLPPKDYNVRYNLCTPSDQHLPEISGGENVAIVGMTPSGRWDFRIPKVVAPIKLIYADRVEERVFRPDTVLIEPNLSRVTLKARLAIVTRRSAKPLLQIAFGHVTPGYILAVRRRKAYVHPGKGAPPQPQAWSA
ncbi:DUF2169 domain-containing protein [Mesorhizobium sp. M1066]|uniref:DUF2169 family type VI secretion system accessory protein n=1 Tax=unclassified Mesorhizobium TaxID=325217 RepID=UPI00333BE408